MNPLQEALKMSFSSRKVLTEEYLLANFNHDQIHEMAFEANLCIEVLKDALAYDNCSALNLTPFWAFFKKKWYTANILIIQKALKKADSAVKFKAGVREQEFTTIEKQLFHINLN